jgi:CAAX prenyl protease-like protein
MITSQGIASVLNRHFVSPAFYRYIPFAVFMGFIGFDEFIRFLTDQGLLTIKITTLYYLYPLKTIVVGYLLYKFRKHYYELTVKDFTDLPATLSSFGLGLLVFALWVKMDWTLGVAGVPQGFNPELLTGLSVQIPMIIFRIAGAVIVVPIMEELFWRSFFIRYIIDKNFDKVRMGTFTWASFLLSVVFFGLEHNFIYAGIMAGISYNILLYRTRSLAQCILAHSVTNLALAIYVIFTGKWQFW